MPVAAGKSWMEEASVVLREKAERDARDRARDSEARERASACRWLRQSRISIGLSLAEAALITGTNAVMYEELEATGYVTPQPGSKSYEAGNRDPIAYHVRWLELTAETLNNYAIWAPAFAKVPCPGATPAGAHSAAELDLLRERIRRAQEALAG